MLTRWDPFRDLKGVEAEFDRIVGQALSKNAWVPALDIRETEDRFEVTADLPGMSSDDVEVTFEDGTLTLRGEREFSRDQDEGQYHRIERVYGSFSRTIELPFKVDADQVQGRFANGVLELELKRPESEKPRRIQIRSS